MLKDIPASPGEKKRVFRDDLCVGGLFEGDSLLDNGSEGDSSASAEGVTGDD